MAHAMIFILRIFIMLFIFTLLLLITGLGAHAMDSGHLPYRGLRV